MFLFFGLQACVIWAPQPGIRMASPALEGWILYQWTAKEAPCWDLFRWSYKIKGPRIASRVNPDGVHSEEGGGQPFLLPIKMYSQE